MGGQGSPGANEARARDLRSRTSAPAKRAKARYELRTGKADCPRGRKPGTAMVARQGDQDEEYDRGLEAEAQLVTSMWLQRILARI